MMITTLRKYYGLSAIFAVLALLVGAAIGYTRGGIAMAFSTALTVAILAVLETSLSFDNAVVNAKILANWDDKWRHRFLTWGMWVAVFGMRVLFPILIVAVTTGLNPMAVTSMALQHPSDYAKALVSVHHEIAGFGGAFLFMVAFSFFLEEKSVYWWEAIESRLTSLGRVESLGLAITMIILYVVSRLIPDPLHGTQFFVAGIMGLLTFILAHGLGGLLTSDDDEEDSGAAAVVGTIIKASFAGFLYIELIDASCSFDGVIGAFVITNYLPVIALGLGIGAVFVRSMTIQLVDTGTLAEYRYLEHGAFYSIFALAVLMSASATGLNLPDWATGLIGAAFIGLAFLNSVSFNRKNVPAAPIGEVVAPLSDAEFRSKVSMDGSWQ